MLISATGPEFLNSEGDPKLFSLGGELDSSLRSGENCGPLQVEATAGTSSTEACNCLWSRIKETADLPSISGDDSKLLLAISLSSGDKWGRIWLEDSSAFSVTSIDSSSWLDLANTLLWSFVSGDDPTPPLSLEAVSGVSLITGEDSGLS